MENILIMKNILNKIQINFLTYIFLLLALLAGFFKNIIIIYFIILIHELGHIFFIKLANYQVLKVTIYPFGGLTTIKKLVNSSINSEIIIAFGGILFQALSLFIFLIINRDIYAYSSQLFIKYNIILIGFNLIPINPLDGHIILKSILEKFLSFKKAFYYTQLISLICFGIFLYFNYYLKLNNYVVLSFLGYKIITNFKNFKYLFNLFLLERYLYDVPYQKIKYINKLNLDKLQRDVFHYFKIGDRIISEKQILSNKFQ